MPVFPIVERLPDPLLTLTGEAVTAWAVQEHELRLLVFLLLSLDPKRGRLALKNLRAKECIDLIADLMHLSDIQSKPNKLRAFGNHLDEIETRRNLLAHNIWLQSEDGEMFLQSLSGAWPSKRGEFKRKRRIDPAGIPITAANLEDLVAAIRNTIRQTRLLHQQVAAAMQAKGLVAVSPSESEPPSE